MTGWLDPTSSRMSPRSALKPQGPLAITNSALTSIMDGPAPTLGRWRKCRRAHGTARCCRIPARCGEIGSKIGSNAARSLIHNHFDIAVIDVTVP